MDLSLSVLYCNMIDSKRYVLICITHLKKNCKCDDLNR